jgi:hypothetical protein
MRAKRSRGGRSRTPLDLQLQAERHRLPDPNGHLVRPNWPEIFTQRSGQNCFGVDMTSLAIMNVDPAADPGLSASDQKRRFSRHATVRIPAAISTNGHHRR